MNMFLSNGQPTTAQYRIFATNNNGVSNPLPKAPSSLKASMITRIHTVKPGCGSCGRH